jgi:hypothetical protein
VGEKSKSRSKRGGEQSDAPPKRGIAGAGATMDPLDIAGDQECDEAKRGEPRYVPAPGVPVSNEQYEWLKRKAKSVRVPPSEHSQEDPSGKRKR